MRPFRSNHFTHSHAGRIVAEYRVRAGWRLRRIFVSVNGPLALGNFWSDHDEREWEWIVKRQNGKQKLSGQVLRIRSQWMLLVWSGRIPWCIDYFLWVSVGCTALDRVEVFLVHICQQKSAAYLFRSIFYFVDDILLLFSSSPTKIIIIFTIEINYLTLMRSLSIFCFVLDLFWFRLFITEIRGRNRSFAEFSMKFVAMFLRELFQLMEWCPGWRCRSFDWSHRWWRCLKTCQWITFLWF